ncbi:MAG: hypothetical protein WA718_19975 [Terriglobales bacterium]
MHNWNDSLKGVLLGALTGIAVGLGGFILAEIPKTHAMGGVVFLLVPFAAGVAITVVSRDLGRISAAVLLATVGSLAVLIAMKMETRVCAMMAFPLLFVGLLGGVGLGYALGYLFRKLRGRFGGNGATFNSIILLAMPLLIFAGHRFEVSKPIQARRQMVISTIRIPAEPSQVWAELESFDSLAGDKPFLMHIGLPIPCDACWKEAASELGGRVISIMATSRRRSPNGRRQIRCFFRLTARICRGGTGSGSTMPGTIYGEKEARRSLLEAQPSSRIYSPLGIGDL